MEAEEKLRRDLEERKSEKKRWGSVRKIKKLGENLSNAIKERADSGDRLRETVKEISDVFMVQLAAIPQLGRIGASESPVAKHAHQKIIRVLYGSLDRPVMKELKQLALSEANPSPIFENAYFTINEWAVEALGRLAKSQSQSAAQICRNIVKIMDDNEGLHGIQKTCLNELGMMGASKNPVAAEVAYHAIVKNMQSNFNDPFLRELGLMEFSRIAAGDGPLAETAYRKLLELINPSNAPSDIHDLGMRAIRHVQNAGGRLAEHAQHAHRTLKEY
ncbi:MAG TPA: hypothetical protein ENN13_01500 [Candidatus Altiarchaeales archaeon]|nr:hypothetical protein [Candidatus Altiarchaeales archaeon]